MSAFVSYASTEMLKIFPFSHKPVKQAVLPHCIWWVKSISTQLNLSHFHLLPHLWGLRRGRPSSKVSSLGDSRRRCWPYWNYIAMPDPTGTGIHPIPDVTATKTCCGHNFKFQHVSNEGRPIWNIFTSFVPFICFICVLYFVFLIKRTKLIRISQRFTYSLNIRKIANAVQCHS